MSEKDPKLSQQSSNDTPTPSYLRARFPVECPICRWQSLVDVDLDQPLLETPQAREIQRHLQEWLRSRCPDHLGPIMETMRN
jgi:hypothetical protein